MRVAGIRMVASLLSFTCMAQAHEPEVRVQADSVQLRWRSAQWIVPAACVTYGVMARFNRLPFRRYDRQVAEWVNTHVDRRYRVDDYLQPAVALFAFGADFIPGVRSEHNLRDRTLLVATSCALTGITVTGMKHTIFVRRPNGSNLSFPSGHTALAFTGAHLLYREYRNQSPWIGIGGYAAATAVGVLRVVNRKHWVSDVVTGAGIGILSVEAAGLMLPVWHRLLGINGAERVVIMPAASINQLEVSLVCRF